MRIPRKRSLAVAALGAAAALLATAGVSSAAPGLGITDVPTPNTKVAGFPRPDKLSPELARHIVAQGSMALENPSGANTYYGYDGTDPLIPLPGTTLEAQKTEPDKNTYLVLPFQKGADPAYDYGSHFLFQGHETGAPGYITRVNLDADVDHRVTLLANSDVTGAPLPVFDGSTWDPFAKRLLFTAELGNSGGVWQATTAVPAQVQDMSGALGRGGYEGIQNDSLGNLYIVEDVGGATLPDKSKAPNSFLYRFVPVNRADLAAGGKLQVLSLQNAGGTAAFDASVNSADVAALHTYGTSFKASWVTIHDTAVDGSTPFDSNALAKAKGGTPFKRPENGVFRPGTNFREFYFTETGDTNATSGANAQFGGWGGVLVYKQANASATGGTVSLVYKGDQDHTGLDNIAFLNADHIGVVEDAGDGLHSQRNALDSAYDIQVSHDYSDGALPVRFLAEGRDASATIDSGLSSLSPLPADFHNEGDNEITGIHVSDGDPTVFGILGVKIPTAFETLGRWRTFYTQQHGDNVTYQVTRRPFTFRPQDEVNDN